MAQLKWTSIFNIKAKSLPPEDSWSLEFDDNLVPNSPNRGWVQYIGNTSARFKCTGCKRSWPSNHVIVVFHMRLVRRKGTVKVRRLRQNCNKCTSAPMEEPSITSENINTLLENLVDNIRKNYYHQDLGRGNRPFVRLDVKSPHEPDHCEACRYGICTRS